MSAKAHLSLGSNVGDRTANLRAALAGLRTAGTVAAVSSFYETEPMEFTAQDWFLNCAVELETELGPRELLAQALGIEESLGRRRSESPPKGPRRIDIDVLLFGDLVVEESGLTIPHPAMHLRRFVLAPLAEIAPQARHPRLGKTVAELLAALPPEAGQVRRIAAHD